MKNAEITNTLTLTQDEAEHLLRSLIFEDEMLTDIIKDERTDREEADLYTEWFNHGHNLISRLSAMYGVLDHDPRSGHPKPRTQAEADRLPRWRKV